MTTDHSPRPFASDAAVRYVGEGLLARRLPKPEWTHEAHLATCLWLLRERPDIDLAADLPGLIRRYNESVGGVNSDTDGYHDTITQSYIRLVGGFLAEHDLGEPLVELVNRLLASPLGHREALLAHYSRDCLFSVEARRGWVEPDLAPLPAGGVRIGALASA